MLEVGAGERKGVSGFKYPSRVWRINWRARDLISFCLLVIIVETKDLIKATSGQKDLLWFTVAGCSLTWWQEHTATNHIASVIRSKEPCMLCSNRFSFLFKTQAHEMMPPLFRVRFPTPVYAI